MFDRKAFFDLVDPNKNITVGFSGGGDSSALLHFCHQLNQQGLLRGNLSAIHINHSLHKNSDQWESHCKIFCKNRGIAFKSYVVNIDSKKSGLESAARNARYKIFEEVIKSNDQLLMAHHADDVAETILFRLFRGTGLDGLQGPINKRTLGEGVIASKQIQQMAELVSKHKKTHDFFLHKQFGEKMEGLKLQRSFLLNLEEEICIEVIRYWIKLNNVAMPNKKIISEILKAFIYSNPTPKTQVHWSRADNEQKSAFLTFCDGDLVLNKK